MDMTRILVIQTGGTIDKDYPKRIQGYAFEIGDSAAEKIIKHACSSSSGYDFLTVCQKDSQDITDSDRSTLSKACSAASHQHILVTHGTDTMINTAQYLAQHSAGKTVVLTGAFLPDTFKGSDAEFNVGFALGALQAMTAPGVYIAMNGTVIPAEHASRDEQSGFFIRKSA